MRKNLQGDYTRKNIRRLYQEKILMGIHKRISDKFRFPMSYVICNIPDLILNMVF
ncbi:MAG: hypothetical protein PHH67_09680 [Methanosarcina sp.]|nr:hypothetical protein [Methanosarcina sp.]MDD4306754.1 hypothetical protein [Methanosarcina sp.]NLN43131.1 hypothetical protein [Methanosarcina sp.]